MYDALEEELSSFTTSCVTCLCCPGSLSDRAFYKLMGKSAVAICLTVVLNILCAAVQDQKNVTSDWEDDMVFGWGATKTRHTTYYAYVYEYQVAGVPISTFITLISGAFVIALDMRGGFREALLNHLSIFHARTLLFFHHKGSKLPKEEQVSFYRWILAQGIDKIVRVFNLSYISAAIFLVGTSDGTVELILNCTALSFMLGLDNMLNERFAMFTKVSAGKRDTSKFVAGIEYEKQIRSLLKVIHDDEHFLKRFQLSVFLNFTAVTIVIVTGGLMMQQYTAYGDTFNFVDDGPLDGLLWPHDANVISKVIRTMLFLVIMVFTFNDAVVVGSALSKGKPMAARVRIAVTSFIVELVVFFFLFIIIHHNFILNFIMKWDGYSRLKDCYDEFGDDCRYRARGYGGDAPN